MSAITYVAPSTPTGTMLNRSFVSLLEVVVTIDGAVKIFGAELAVSAAIIPPPRAVAAVHDRVVVVAPRQALGRPIADYVLVGVAVGNVSVAASGTSGSLPRMDRT